MKSNGAATILRWGLAFVFFYAAVAALLWPDAWAGYVPGFIAAVFPVRLFLSGFSFYELVLAGFLFWGRKLFWSSLFAAITLTAIVVFDFGAMGVVFRDVGLAFSALALIELSRKDNDQKNGISE